MREEHGEARAVGRREAVEAVRRAEGEERREDERRRTEEMRGDVEGRGGEERKEKKKRASVCEENKNPNLRMWGISICSHVGSSCGGPRGVLMRLPSALPS